MKWLGLATEKARPEVAWVGDAQHLADCLPALVMDARKTLASLTLGVHGRRRAGTGETFWQHREWRAGEGLRQVDWRRSARSDRLFVRDMERESPANLEIWVDTGPNMAWRHKASRPTKAERALVIGLALAMAAKAGGERVSTLLGQQVMTEAESFGRALVASGQSFDLQPRERPIKPSQIVIISDGLAAIETWNARLKPLTDHAQPVTFILVCDPDEEAFPFEGRVLFASPAGGEPVLIGQAQAAREAYQRLFRQHIEALRSMLSQMRGHLLVHATDQPALPVVVQAAARLDGRMGNRQQAS